MANWKCNACGATYSDTLRDGGPYTHVCGPEIVSHEVTDDKGQIVKPRVEREYANHRDENPLPGVAYDAKRKGHVLPDPDDPTGTVFYPGPVPIKSEGAGRTAV